MPIPEDKPTATRDGGLCPSWILVINRLSVHPFMVLIVPRLGLSSGGPASQFLSFLVKSNTISIYIYRLL